MCFVNVASSFSKLFDDKLVSGWSWWCRDGSGGRENVGTCGDVRWEKRSSCVSCRRLFPAEGEMMSPFRNLSRHSEAKCLVRARTLALFTLVTPPADNGDLFRNSADAAFRFTEGNLASLNKIPKNRCLMAEWSARFFSGSCLADRPDRLHGATTSSRATVSRPLVVSLIKRFFLMMFVENSEKAFQP